MDKMRHFGQRARTRAALGITRWVLSICGALGAFAAQAGGFPVCVSTNTELANALASAEFVPTTIKIVQGNYDIRNTPLHAGAYTVSLQGGTELLGGYTAVCAARNIEVGNTVLDDSNSAHTDLDGADTLGDL